MAPVETKKVESVSLARIDNGYAFDRFMQKGPPRLSDYSTILDESTFEQILEMDDDEEDRDFSRSIVYGFFDQAESTFKKIQKEM